MQIAEHQGFRILRIADAAEAAPYRPSFVGAYQTVFADPPYRERYFPSEAQAVLDRTLQTPSHITLLAVRGLAQVAGFGLGVPLQYRPEAARHLMGLLPVQTTFYLSELGVLRPFRGRGLGRRLVLERLRLVDRQRYSHVVLRTSASRDAAYHLYTSLGFEDVGVSMEVSSRRIDGLVTTDRRIFLSMVL